MQGVARTLGAIVAGAAVLVASTAAEAAIDDKDQRKCIETIAKEGAKYVKARMAERSKCADKSNKQAGSCDTVKRDEKIAKADSKLRNALDKKCGDQSKLPLPDLSLQVLGFPGKCADPTGPPFTNDELEGCIVETHRDLADALLTAEHGANIVDPIPLLPATPADLGKCQKEIFKNGQKFLQTILKEVSKCRNALNSGKESGFDPVDCRDNPILTKPKEKIDKAETKLRDKITGKCSNDQIAALDICGGVATAAAAADCIVQTHLDAGDNPDQAAPADFIDIEYAQRALCGDNIANDPLAAVGKVGNFALGEFPEECDGNDDGDCPGQCGAPGSAFPCLCLDVPRLRVVEHEGGDLDNGWTGVSHDQASIVEGSGYTLDLYDCDGPGGPDTVCTVGPSCNLAPNGPCVSNANCPGVGNFCRKRPTTTGPHCNENVQQPCENQSQCPGASNFCRKTPASTPIGAAAGGVAVCNQNIWSEDIVGTHDVATGAGALRLRRDALTYFGGGVADQPCPVCGGFCNAPATTSSVGQRKRCTTDADCFGVPTVGQPGTCVTAQICSWGPNADQPCRPDPPFGGESVFFGTTSIDCLPGGGDISGGGLDIVTDKAVTGTASLLPSFTCTAPGFGSNACVAGSNTGATCGADSDCTGGGAGSCRGQCFCPTGPPTTPQAPNACNAACVGGANDALGCTAPSDCPGGFCHSGDCRLASTLVCVGGSSNTDPCTADSDCPGGTCGDFTSTQEGYCPAGPINGLCSLSEFRGCASEAECKPPMCTFCDPSETCVFRPKQCFVNSGITRVGTPGPVDRVTAAIFCIPGTGNPSIDVTGGFTGPGTSVQPMTLSVTGF